MKISAFVFAVFFAMALSTSVYAADTPAGTFCDPKKMEECKSKLDSLLKSLDNLRDKIVKSQMELKAGRKLTNEEAEQMLRNMDSIERSWSPSRGYLWDN